jgi:hypothetical protein
VGGFNETTMNFRCSGGANRFHDRGPSLEEVQRAFGRLAEGARAKLGGKSVDEEQRQRDHDTTNCWQRAEGVDLMVEAERTKAKLRAVDRVQQ